MADFDDFMAAIARIESGGRYNAIGPSVNGHHAYGKYQVMDFNIGAWTRQVLGKSLTPSQFLNNPQAQEQVARSILRGYVQRYGYYGAAQAWYGGPGGVGKSYTANYASRAVSYMNNGTGSYSSPGGRTVRYQAVSAGGGGGSTGSTMDRDERAQRYGFVEALFATSGELKRIFNQAVAGDWSPAKFQAQLRKTAWWRHHSAAWRRAAALKASSPAEYTARVKATRATLDDIAGQMGAQLSSKQLARIAELTFKFGYNESQQRDLLAHYVSGKGGYFKGEAAANETALRQFAYANGLRISTPSISNWVKSIAFGNQTLDTFRDYMRKQAMTAFPAYADQIKAGLNVIDLAQPYIQSMSQLLEVNPEGLDLFDPTIRRALQFRQQDGKLGQMSLSEFERGLRKDKRWLKTQNAQDSAMNVARSILTDFGFLAGGL